MYFSGHVGLWTEFRSNVWSRAYICAHFGKSLFWYLSEFFLTLFFVTGLHLSSIKAACFLAAGLGFSAFLDIGLSRVFLRRLDTPVLSSQLQLYGAIGCTVSFSFMISMSFWRSLMSEAGLLLASLLFRVSYELYDMGQETLISLFSSNIFQRRRFIGLRMIGSGAAALLMSFLVGGFSVVEGHQSFWILSLIGVFPLLSLLTAYKLLTESRKRQDLRKKTQNTGNITIFYSKRRTLTVQFVTIFVSAWIGSYFARFFPFLLHDPDSAVRFWMLACYPLGIIAVQPFWALLVSLYGERVPMLVACNGLAVLVAGFLPIKQVMNMPLSALAVFFFGIGCGCVGSGLWSRFVNSVSDGGEGMAHDYGRFLAAAKLGLSAMTLTLGEQLTYKTSDQNPHVFIILEVTACIVVGVCFSLDSNPRRTASDKKTCR